MIQNRCENIPEKAQVLNFHKLIMYDHTTHNFEKYKKKYFTSLQFILIMVSMAYLSLPILRPYKPMSKQQQKNAIFFTLINKPIGEKHTLFFGLHGRDVDTRSLKSI